MKLVWNLTGDWLELDPVNQELAAYWIQCLDQSRNNIFHLESNSFDPSWPAVLKTHLCTIDDFLISKLKITALSVFREQDFVDQSVLNEIHRVWIKLIINYPKLVNVISHNSDLRYHWDQINKKIHFIEEGFSSIYIAKQHWEIPNIFGHKVLNFNSCQLRVMFSQKGRTSFNKWEMFDYNLEDLDTNDYLNIGSEVTINLRKPKTCAPPKEYVDFCNLHNMPVVGSTLNLANFSNFETNLSEIRHIYLRNIADENNTASFKF